MIGSVGKGRDAVHASELAAALPLDPRLQERCAQ